MSDRSLPMLISDERRRQEMLPPRPNSGHLTVSTATPYGGSCTVTDGTPTKNLGSSHAAGSLDEGKGDEPSPSARVADLQSRVIDLQVQLVESQRLALSRASEVAELLAKLAERDSEIVRLKSKERLASTSVGATSREARVADLEAENGDLREKLRVAASGSEEEEMAVRRLQRAIRPWVAQRARQRQPSQEGSARDHTWKQNLREAEDAVSRALDRASNQGDLGRVPKQTQLQLLANMLKQGVFKVNQMMMQQTLQDLKRTTGS